MLRRKQPPSAKDADVIHWFFKGLIFAKVEIVEYGVYIY
jgi:hypothetical protein